MEMRFRQNNSINNFIKKYGGVDVIETEDKVQLNLHRNMIEMEGLTFEWLNIFSWYFSDIVIGIPTNSEYGMYISLNKNK